MPKPDPTLLDPARYPFSCAIEPRFSDLDFHHHVNNAALADILQEGRIRFHHASAFDDALHSNGMSSMLVSLSIEFLGQARHPEPLDNHLCAVAVGKSSHTLGHLVTQGGNIIAYAQGILVCVRDSQPVENPPAFIESISKWMLKP
jgi:acyl-CoA thioester hydrolase